MADFRKVMGPFGREIVTAGDIGIRWGFIGILANYETAHWTLIYRAEDRSFSVFRSQPQSMRVVDKSGTTHWKSAGPLVDKDMFIRGANAKVFSGTVTNVLRSRLPPEDIALCARISMKGATS